MNELNGENREQPARSNDDRKMVFLTLLEVLKTKKHFFYLTVSLTLIGTLLGHYLQVPTYQTTSTLFVQTTDQPSAAEYLLNQNVYKLSRFDRLESYINHLNSDSFLLKVAEKIKFNKDFDTLNITAPEKKSALHLAYWKEYFLKNEEDGVSNEEEQKLLLPVDRIAGFLKKSVNFVYEPNSQFIVVSVKTLDPRTSQMIANMVAEEFVSITNNNNLNEVKQVEEFVKVKKAESEQKVRELDQKLISFKQKNNIISTDATTKGYAERLSNLDTQIEMARLQQEEKEKILLVFKKGRKDELNKIFKDGSKTEGFGNFETSYILQSKIEQLKREKSSYIAQGFQEDSWQVQKINTEIDTNVQRLKLVAEDSSNIITQLNPEKAREKIDEIKESLNVIKARLTTLITARDDLRKQVELLPNLQQEYIQIENLFKNEVENLTNLQRKERELEIQRISHKKEIRVDQLAEIPGPSTRGSLPLKLVFSIFSALFLGTIIILGLESLDPSVKSRQDVYDCGLEFFGEIPFVRDEKRAKKRVGRFQFGSPEDLICKTKPESIESMSFKYMRARIESIRYKEKKTSQVISLSSALHNEGKSFVSANLALSLSQIKRKVLLIDADLRRPSQSAYFGVSNQTGLVDLLNLKRNLNEVLIPDLAPNLDFLPAGLCGEDSTELISSEKFRFLIEHFRQSYEYIVIDTPPTFAAVDAAIISSLSDLPIVTTSFRESRKADVYEAYNDLLQVSYKKVYGVINKAMVSNSRIHYYGYPLYTDNAHASVAALSKTNNQETEEFLKRLNKKTS